MSMDDHEGTNQGIEQVETKSVSPELPEAPTVTFVRRDSFLFNVRIPMWKYILRMAPLSLIPSVAFGLLLTQVGILTDETGPPIQVSSPADFAMIVILSPVVETLILSSILWALAYVTRFFIPRAIMSAVIWGGIHSLIAPAWGLIVWWPFFIFACSFLAWRRKSWNHAFLVALCIHMIQNFFPAIVLAVGG